MSTVTQWPWPTFFWSMFSGVVLFEASKKIIDPGKDYLKSTLTVAFEIFEQGIRKKKA
ncbi:hypothetical protein PL2TA16_04506 [Pseudoalteromonas luteoviolacea 2ta16]|uniref:Uncharacterized protein n=1 Tax=Pseudoalteromonas luteoviolacea (strain 2ta16) TaxID=1353533 RepID=V4JB83_PSEL2|nr:hypothetical protein PL2TA16_04506 [Pseudoalteromonas luteoviolacea 2ta16]